MGKTPAELTMVRETRVAYGSAPRSLGDEPLAELSWEFSADEFLLRTIGEHYFHYRPGKGITVERGSGASLDDEHLWLNGTVYAAIASLNGLIPIHASAVAVNDTVYAFAGPPGAGKSTLVAGLGQRGLPLFCDDTLVLDPGDAGGRILCLPGHKRLKLAADSIALAGAERLKKVSKSVDKFYARSAAGEVATALPLAELIFIEEGPAPAIEHIAGFERFAKVRDDHYTFDVYAGAQGFSVREHFAHLVRLAENIPMSRFRRSLDRARFDDGLTSIADHISRCAAARSD